MALPTDAISKYHEQDARAIILEAETLCRTLRQDIWDGYVFESPSTVRYGRAIDPENLETIGGTTPELTLGKRKMRILGCLLGVSYTTNDATTEAAIVTAVQALIP
jgi:hypothetical protein